MGIEKGIPKRTGLLALAHTLAVLPDHEGFIFRRFDRLSARNLLHLEGKLAYLEWKLEQADQQALESHDNEALRSLRAWEAFEENARDTSRPEHLSMKIANEIQQTLKEYQDALSRQHQISSLGQPEERVLEVLRDHRSLLAGLANRRLDDSNDLVAVRPPADKDLLSRFLQNHWMFKTTKVDPDTDHIKESHVTWAAGIISTVVAAFLLVGAIVMLRLLASENHDLQLGLIAMFVALFAASVAILTNAKRAEIFASSAAYAAVLVVFVSTSPGGGEGSCTCPPAG
ncbi:hypothetical protein QBC35DRAFT_550175 [Podospora australis]|uniref:DUF6594 domain-containing protein n=1 Tax=Podospora australis TaxID=1536484 RepID=A0AAN7AI76_9PEZI|nr:hypothetical protein QBC35DRAFT_550175 [Podospora australis]